MSKSTNVVSSLDVGKRLIELGIIPEKCAKLSVVIEPGKAVALHMEVYAEDWQVEHIIQLLGEQKAAK
jgi:hypothetical protein